jgi:hypothetical protein
MRITLLSHEPSDEFLDAIRAAGIIVRKWEMPNWCFRKRKSLTHSVKTEGGWIKPTEKYGELKLTISADEDESTDDENDPMHKAHQTVLKLAEEHGQTVHPIITRHG